MLGRACAVGLACRAVGLVWGSAGFAGFAFGRDKPKRHWSVQAVNPCRIGYSVLYPAGYVYVTWLTNQQGNQRLQEQLLS